ncbi:MAG TPA: urate hydroxylase PuuD [Xanthobacteraceae bacterium]|nr:urate hydroxylase PuuD [Xanthobacteraceae bacterium]
MDVFVADWLNLALRWAHLVVGIGWIGTSFYFIALDYGLRREQGTAPGVLGAAWQVHGGGFLHVEKYAVAPPRLPEHLIWFRWEAYLTWVTGFGLLVVQYYWNARAYLIDPTVADIAPVTAIAVAVASLVLGWLIYDALCRSFADKQPMLLAIAVFVLIAGAAYLLGLVLSGRGAFIHVGSLVGTIMTANVFLIIIPNQKKLTAQLIRGEGRTPSSAPSASSARCTTTISRCRCS